MSMFGAFANSDPASQNNFNPSWMGQTFNPTSGVPRPMGRPNGPNGEGEEDRPMAPPIFMRNRYGREDVLALYDSGSVHPPDGLPRCPLYQPEPQPPCVIKPLSDIEKKLRENINSSKAMSMLSAADRHHITSGGTAPESPQAMNRNNSNGWTHVPARSDHSKTWSRTTTGTPPTRGSVRGAFTGGRGGGTAGGGAAVPMEGGVAAASPYGSPAATTPQPNGERALGTGGTFPSRRGVNPVARGGVSSAFNSRAQGLYNPHDPSDRPRQRGRSTSEDGEGGATATPVTPGVPTVNGGGGGQPGAWQPQSRPSAWTRPTDQPMRMPEWATDEDGGVAGGVSRDHSTEVSSGTFDEQGRFVRTAPRPQPLMQQQPPVPQPVQHESHQRVSPQSSMHTANWTSMEREVPLTAPMEMSSHSSHYSMGGVPTSLPSQQQQPDLQGGVSGMSPSSAFLYAYQQQQQQAQQQQQQQAQQQAAQFAALQQAQQQQQKLQQSPPAPAAPAKPATFFYLDPNQVERGPFAQDQMEAWFNMGYFQDSLQVRRDSDSSFTELGELQKRNGKNPFKYPEPVVAAPVPIPTPNMLAGYMDHQLGLGSAGGWDQSVQSIFRGAQATPSYEALMEKQRMELRERQIAEEREKLLRMQEMLRLQQETEREQHQRVLREKEEGLQKLHDDMMRQHREMEESKRMHEATLEKEKREIERKRAELESQNNREKEELRKKQEAEKRKMDEIAEKRRQEQERIAAAEEAEREKERTKQRAEEAKRQAEEDKKRREEERKRAEAFARAEELRQEAEREQAAERERQAQIAAARRAAAPPPPAVPTPPTTPAVVKSSGPAWGGAGIATVQSTVKKPVETRSLAEVMAEEERQARAEQRENERLRREAEAAAPRTSSSSKGGVWGGVTPSTIASQAVPVSSSAAAWGGAGLAKNGPAKPSPWAGPSLSEANKPKAAPKPAAAPAKTKAPEKVVKKEEKKKSVSDEAQFISWFIARARALNDTVDGDVLASFIQDIANPDEVEDYMVGYLGEGKQVKEFVREYIHKRSELRNKGKASTSVPQDKDGFSSVQGKKGAASASVQQKKKAKFVVDSACLGFRPAGDPNRVNQGEIDHPEPAAGRR